MEHQTEVWVHDTSVHAFADSNTIRTCDRGLDIKGHFVEAHQLYGRKRAVRNFVLQTFKQLLAIDDPVKRCIISISGPVCACYNEIVRRQYNAFKLNKTSIILKHRTPDR